MLTYTFEIDKKIHHLVNHLSTLQTLDGSFPSYSSPFRKTFKNFLLLRSAFPTYLILTCLNSLGETGDKTLQIRKKIINFLLLQKSKNYTFNYWVRSSQEYKDFPYPDDLDDTFCALIGLFEYDKRLVTGEVLAAVTTILTSVEKKIGGPYRTWLVEKNAPYVWQDLDIVVNSNIAFFLSKLDIVLPNIVNFVEKLIMQENISSPYYVSAVQVIYFLSRWYNGKFKEKLVNFLLIKKKTDGSFGNILDTALTLCSLLRLQYPYEKLSNTAKFLLKQDVVKISNSFALYIDPSRNGKKYYAGSPALTISFYMEALHLFSVRSQKQCLVKLEPALSNSKTAQRLYLRITQKVDTLLEKSDKSIFLVSKAIFSRISSKDTSRQIPLLPYYFSLSIGSKDYKINEKLLVDLGVATVLGWLAYTIYDDFLDNEGQPIYLPLANFSHRLMISLLDNQMYKKIGVSAFFHETLNKLESANLWEAQQCRLLKSYEEYSLKTIKIPYYKNFDVLANKSLGHSIGPVGVTLFLGFKKNSIVLKHLLTFFNHYLIARQLNDDAHDWENDLISGHINSASYYLFNQAKIHLKKDLDLSLKKILPKLRSLFWAQTLITISKDILIHGKQARNALSLCSLIKDKSIFENLLVKYEEAAYNALYEQKQAQDFLASYS